MFTGLMALCGRIGSVARRAWLIFIVLLAVVWFGGLGVLALVHQIRPPAPRVVEEPPPLGGEPIRVVMGELELDIPRIRIVRISPVDGDSLKLSDGSDRIALARLEEAAQGERIPIRGVSFIFYSAFGYRRCELPEQLEFLCEYGRPGEQPSLSTFSVGRFNQRSVDLLKAQNIRNFEVASADGIDLFSQYYTISRTRGGGYFFRNSNDYNIIITCSYFLCDQSGHELTLYGYGIKYSIDFNSPHQLEVMTILHKRIVAALAPHPNTNTPHERR